jgi:cytoskeletal protein RodZ
MDMIGQYLSNLRKEAGLTVEEMALKTRIRLDYLKAIEDDSFNKAPADVYVKGYIRTYLKILSIDPAEGLRIYAAQRGGSHAARADTLSHHVSPVVLSYNKSTTHKGIVIVVILIALAGGGLFFYWNTILPDLSFFLTLDKIPDVPPKQKPMDSETIPSGGSSQQAPQETAKPTPLPKPTTQHTTTITATKPDALKHTLQLQATSLTWISVQIDNKDTHQRLMNPGESLQWNAEDTFTLKLGNAGGVKLTLDGEYLGVPGESGRVVTLVLPKKTPTPVQ